MMKSSGCLTLVLLFHLSRTLGDQDYHYCGHTLLSQTFQATATIDEVLATSIARKSSSGLLLTDSTTGAITMARPDVTSAFMDSTSKIIDPSAFCDVAAGVDNLYSADLNGDGQDDLLCHKSDGTFVARKSYHTHSGSYQSYDYEKPSPVAKNFNCLFTSAIYLGDFDGNGADDILCVASLRSAYTIYFNLFHPNNRKRIHDHFNLRRHWEHAMSPLPKAYSVSSPLPCPVGTIIVADVNGDSLDDIVCHNGAVVSYYISKRESSTTIQSFEGEKVATALTLCDTATQTLLAADVDGDGDDDLLCIKTDTNANTDQVLIAYYSTGVYGTQFAAESESTCNAFCLGNVSPPPAPPAQLLIGDFNNDGKDDILCRYHATAAAPWARGAPTSCSPKRKHFRS